MRVGHLAAFIGILAVLSVAMLFSPTSSTFDLLLHPFPSVPSYPKAKDLVDRASAYGVMSFTTSDSGDAVEKFYITALQNEGWTYLGKESVCESLRMEFRKSQDGRDYSLKLEDGVLLKGELEDGTPLLGDTSVTIRVSKSGGIC